MPHSLLYLCCPEAERAATERLLRQAGFEPRWADSADAVISALGERESVVLADFADSRALGIVRELRRQRPNTFLLAVSDPFRPEAVGEIERAGLPVVLQRPLNPRMLSLLSSANGDGASAEDGRAKPSRSPVFAESPSMRAALDLATKFASEKGGVLICGESGTGRALVAREIHEMGARNDGPFVAVDCADISGEELEARLFGGLDGDARETPDRRRAERLGDQGLIARARGGTLFLAHVGEMSSRLQARLARLLRDDEAVVGDSRRPVPLELRPVASGDLNWDAAVADGRIRQDLSRRLSVSRVTIPPLRSRREDIPQLAAYLLREACGAHRVPLKSIEPPALALLMALPWRGNGRELRTLMTILAGRAASTSIHLEDVLANVRLDGAPRSVALGGTLREARLRFEREYITAVIEHHRGRIGEAARALGIQRTNLYRKMRALKVAWRSNGHQATG